MKKVSKLRPKTTKEHGHVNAPGQCCVQTRTRGWQRREQQERSTTKPTAHHQRTSDLGHVVGFLCQLTSGDATVEVPASFRVGARQSLGWSPTGGARLSAPLGLKRLLGVMKPTGR